MTKRDFLLVALLAFLALSGFTFYHFWSMGRDSQWAEITAQGETIERINLKKTLEEKEITVKGPLGDTVIEIAPHKARIISSPCPDKICVHMGWITMPGQSAVCMPNKIVLKVMMEENPVDSITH